MTGKQSARVSGKGGRTVPTSTPIKEGLAFLIESELERAEVILAAKGITTKLQDIAESLSTIEAKDIMPMLDSFRETFGPQAADQFSQVATSKLRELIGAVQTSKNAIDTEINRLEQMVNGGDGSDMALDGAAPGGDASIAPPAAPLDAPPGDLPSDLPPDVAAPPEPPEDALGAAGFAGRARKEGARRRGKALNEDDGVRRPEENYHPNWTPGSEGFYNGMYKKGPAAAPVNAAEEHDFQAHLQQLAALSPKCYTVAHDILDSIHNLAVGGDVRNKLIHALGHLIAMADNPALWDDPEAVAELGVATHFVDVPMGEVVRTPEVAAIVKNLRRLAHTIAFKHSGHMNEDDMSPPSATLPAPAPASPLAAGPVMESAGRRAKNVRRLRESHDPDKLILRVFRRVFRECRDVSAAVRGTARAFGIDASDVVMIIREAKQLREDAVPALMGVEMGAPDPNTNPALMGQNPNAANPQPGKPNAPMTPADMRAAQQARTAQDDAAGIAPKQPITAPTTMAPTQLVKPNQQLVQPVTPQMQQQQNANAPKPKNVGEGAERSTRRGTAAARH